jgi:hypothetical protein
LAGVEIRRYSSEQPKRVTGWLVGVLDGALQSMAAGFVAPLVILAGLAVQLTDRSIIIGVIPVIATSVWTAGAFFAQAVIRTRRIQRPWAFIAALIRTGGMAFIAYSAYRANISDTHRLRLLLLGFIVYAAATGFGSVPTRNLLIKSASGPQRIGLFLRRATLGVVLAVIAALVNYRVLETTELTTPRNFSYLFIAATAALASASFFLLLVREPRRVSGSDRHQLHFSVSAALKDQPFRRYLSFRVILAAAAAIDVFLVVYVLRELDAPLRFLGIYAGAIAVAVLVSLPVWRQLANARGGRLPLQAAAFVRFVIPLIVLLIPFIEETDFYIDRANDQGPLHWLMVVPFACLGLSLAAQIAGHFQYLLEITPRTRGSAYVDTSNLVLAAVAFLAIGAGWIIEAQGYRPVFAVAAVLSLVSILLSGLLTEVRESRLRIAQQARPRRLDARSVVVRR